MEIEKVYAIDTMGTYPIAFVQYLGCSPSWRQYQNNEQIKSYLAAHDNYVVNDPYWKF